MNHPQISQMVIYSICFSSMMSVSVYSEAGEPFPVNRGKVLFEDVFAREELGKSWSVHPDSFRIEKGVLVAGQRTDVDHGAVSQTYIDFKDLVLKFSFQFDGAPGFNVVIDDRNYKGSHAGHICRVTVRENRMTLQDDKTGAMEKKIFNMRRDPKQRKAADRLLIGKSKWVPMKFQRGKWYTMVVAIDGDQMQVQLDGKQLGTLESDGIGHATKTDFGFTIPGRFMRFDDVTAWEVKKAGR